MRVKLRAQKRNSLCAFLFSGISPKGCHFQTSELCAILPRLPNANSFTALTKKLARNLKIIYIVNIMRKFLLSLSAFAGVCLLSACAGTQNTTVLFKPNTPPAAKQADLDKCKIASFKLIPQAITTQYVGGYYDPGDMECSRSGRHGGYMYCDQFGGFYNPPYAYTEDVNSPIRWRYVSACLQKKGYYIIYNKPPCSNGADYARAIRAHSPADLVCNPDANLDY